MKWYEMTNCPHCGAKLEWNGGNSDWTGESHDAVCKACGILFSAFERKDFEVEEDPLQAGERPGKV